MVLRSPQGPSDLYYSSCCLTTRHSSHQWRGCVRSVRSRPVDLHDRSISYNCNTHVACGQYQPPSPFIVCRGSSNSGFIFMISFRSFIQPTLGRKRHLLYARFLAIANWKIPTVPNTPTVNIQNRWPKRPECQACFESGSFVAAGKGSDCAIL